MKRLTVFLFLVVLPFVTQAQTPVTVTGLITDAGNNPATSGFVQFDVTPKASSIHYFISGIGTITQTVQCGIDGTGHVKSQLNLANPCTVWGNDLINPANTQYKVTFAPNGTITNVVNGECITGSSYSLNNPVFCPIVQISPQQAIVRSNPFQTNILPIAGATFNIGSPSLPYGSIYSNNLFLNGAQFSPANVAFINVANVFTLNNTFPSITSASANPAAAGVFRLANSEIISWRNVANNGDLPLTGDSLNRLSFPSGGLFIGGSIQGAAFQPNTANPALSGIYRMASSDFIAWRNNANSADIALSKQPGVSGNFPADTLIAGTGISASFFTSNAPTIAVGGLVRMLSTDTLNWRNNANSADVGLSKNSSDQFSFNGGGLLYDISANVLKNSANTVGHYPRNNGTQYVDNTIQQADLPATGTNCTGGTGTYATGLNAGGTPICSTPTPTVVNSVFTNKALAGDVSVSATTLTTVDSIALTMPSSGCPCRVFIAFGYGWTYATSGGVDFYATDGTTNFIHTPSKSTSGGTLVGGANGAGYTSVTYANNATPTITIKVQTEQAITVKAAAFLAGPNSFMQASVQTSN